MDLSEHNALHVLHVNVIWALFEDAGALVRDLSEIRVMHNMTIEDENWVIDDRLKDSTPEKLRGCKKFFGIPMSTGMSSLSRKASFIGESTFKDFREYCKGSVSDFQVLQII